MTDFEEPDLDMLDMRRAPRQSVDEGAFDGTIVGQCTCHLKTHTEDD
jgi:hypothetical protein